MMAKRSAKDVAETIGVILNPGSGYVTRHGVKDTCALLQDAVPGARVHVLGPHDDVMRCSQELLSAGATIVVAAGGDGTVNGVAAALAGSEAALGVLPAGTFNHFASDIGLAHGMRHALHALLAGQTKSIDVGSVNGNLFLNNSSIGLYPHLVELRERVEKGQGRVGATIEAALLMAQQGNRPSVSFAASSQTQTFQGSFLFVGNNRYAPDPLHRRFRPRLDEGALWCLILNEPPSDQHTAEPIQSLQGHRPERHGPHALTTQQLTIALASDDTTPVSTDGEVRVLHAPLEYRIHTGALRVIAPA
jgi:diacylglycerol kinase family enzyme